MRLDLVSCIKAHGGRLDNVISQVTPKRYTIISQQSTVDRKDGKCAPQVIRIAVRKSFEIVEFSCVVDSVWARLKCDVMKYQLDLTKLI